MQSIKDTVTEEGIESRTMKTLSYDEELTQSYEEGRLAHDSNNNNNDREIRAFSQDTFNLLFKVMNDTGLRLQFTKITNGRASLVAFTPNKSPTAKRARKYKRTVLATDLTEEEAIVVLGVLDKLEVCDDQKDPERSWQDYKEEENKKEKEVGY